MTIPQNPTQTQHPGIPPRPAQAMTPRPAAMTPLRYEFKGSTIGHLFVSLGAGILTVITLGIALPWAQAMLYRWTTENTYVNGQRMRFTGSGGRLFGQYIKWWLLTVVTVGIYGFVVANRMRKWAIEHQEVAVPIA